MPGHVDAVAVAAWQQAHSMHTRVSSGQPAASSLQELRCRCYRPLPKPPCALLCCAAPVCLQDGRFVPNITIGPLVVEAIRPVTDKVLDCHLVSGG